MKAELEDIIKDVQGNWGSLKRIQKREEAIILIRKLFEIDYLISREIRMILDESSSLDEKVMELQKFNDQIKGFFNY
jgi:hypothetical protein